MAELLSSASYVRNQAALRDGAQQKLDDALRSSQWGGRAWELLQTPQTVVSLSRALARDQSEDESRYRTDVEQFMEQLFAKDLIQVSPDS